MRRRPTLAQEEGEEYAMPASSTLYDDAAGLKLFLDILNGPDGQNREAEAELRKLIDRRRTRMSEEGGEGRRRRVEDAMVENMDEESRTRKVKVASRRRRRHHASNQEGVAVPEVVLDERRVEGEVGERRRERRSGRKSRPDPVVPPGNPYLSSTAESDDTTHIATTHEDTTTGAVHCFRDEYGNWQTYTFGTDTAASSTVGAPASSSRAIAGLINRQQRPTEEQGREGEVAEREGREARREGSRSEREGREERRDGSRGEREGREARREGSPPSSRSSGSADSGLTVILDSPAMVFQPGEDGGGRGEYWRGEAADYSRESSRDSYWSRWAGGCGMVPYGGVWYGSPMQVYWVWYGMVWSVPPEQGHLCAGRGAAPALWGPPHRPGLPEVSRRSTSTSALVCQLVLRYNNPLHMFAESFLDRTRQAAR